MAEVLAQLSRYPVRTRLSLSGSLVVARDIAHAKLQVGGEGWGRPPGRAGRRGLVGHSTPPHQTDAGNCTGVVPAAGVCAPSLHPTAGGD